MAAHLGETLLDEQTRRPKHTDSDLSKDTPFVIQAFEPIVEMARWIGSLIPTRFRFSVRANFIAVHYLYMILMTLMTSVIVYGAGLIPYIDALFFASGAVTQSGLNTIDINKLETYQQVTFMLVACVCTPIFIHTFVVFVRLYWFEKRFEKVVQEARDKRRLKITPTLSKSKSQANERDMAQLERGIGGKDIQVLHDTTQPNGMSGRAARMEDHERDFREKMGLEADAMSITPTPEGSDRSHKASVDGNPQTSDDSGRAKEDESVDSPDSEHHLGLGRLRREITFADEVRPTRPAHQPADGGLERLPENPAVSKHIEFIERQQRNAREGSAIRIPGPRDFDRGAVPQTLQESNEDLRRLNTANSNANSNSLHQAPTEPDQPEMNGDGNANREDNPERMTTHIAFDEPNHPGHRRNESNMDRVTSNTSKMGPLKKIISANGHLGNTRHRRNTSASMRPAISEARTSIGRSFTNFTTRAVDASDPMPYLSWTATTGRNSAFVGLTEEQREELGGIEYRALKTLAKVLVWYFVGFHVSGLVLLLPWIVNTNPWKSRVAEFGVDPAWWGVFTPASLFNDLGFTLTPDSMSSFQTAVLPLLYGTFLIIIGNTGFPCMLRFVIWVTSKCVRYGSPLWEELRFLLDHPRRCFTLLFPSTATWWLFWVLVILNGLDLILFIILDLNDPAVTHLHPGYRVLVGLFQAASTRTAGFSAVSLSELHPAVQVSYMIMMYISVFPIAISLRRTNVYEEKSLGVYGGNSDDNEEGEGEKSYVGQHLRRQLSFDLWYVFLGLFIIAIVEGDRLQNTNDWAFTMFSVLFEIVSAYGTVGLSLGYPGFNTSFSGQFRVLSKLVIIAMMLRGRHRGLPYALDRAILLPSESLQQKEAEDADLRYNKRRGTGFPLESEDHALGRQTTNNDDARSLGPATSAHDMAMTDAAGGERSPERIRPIRRKTSGLSSRSEGGPGPHQRRRSLSRVLVGGLSAGPTFSKAD